MPGPQLSFEHEGEQAGRAGFRGNRRSRGACWLVHLAIVAASTLLAVNVLAAPVETATTVRAPADLLQRADFQQKLGAQIPLDLKFNNAQGKTVTLRDAMGGKPTLLVPGYFDCTNLCSIVRSGVANAVSETGFVPSQQFNVVLVSINPRETSVQARMAQTMDAQSHPSAHVAHWRYLTGAGEASAALMHAIGFHYFLDERNNQYAHAAGIVLLTPQGKVAQYLFGVKFPAKTLRLSLVSASHGTIGTIVDRLLLLCCDYDASTGRYSLTIHRVMQALGVLTVLVLVTLILTLLRLEKHRAARLHQASRDAPP